MFHRRHDTSCLLLRNGLPLEPYTLLLQLKSLFLFITGQNKCTCKVIKKCTLLLSSTVALEPSRLTVEKGGCFAAIIMNFDL